MRVNIQPTMARLFLSLGLSAMISALLNIVTTTPAGAQSQQDPFAWILVAPPAAFGASQGSLPANKWILLAGFPSQADCQQAMLQPVISGDGNGNRWMGTQPSGEQCIARSDLK